MKLNNINGTSAPACSCGSWLEHWTKFSGQSIPVLCPAFMCMEKIEAGAHVQKDGTEEWYIVPLCKNHSAKTGESISVNDYFPLVSADVSATCGK
jgi:hypothetical protein